MKKYLLILITLTVTIFGLTACGDVSKHEGEFIDLNVVNATGEEIEVSFPKDPVKIVVLNYITLDYLYTMGLEDIVVGTIYGDTMPNYLKEPYEDAVHLGGMKDFDIEEIMNLEPHAIFSSDRSEAQYDTLSEIAPTYSVSVNYADGYYDSYKETNSKHSQIFTNGDKKVEDIFSSYEDRLNKIEQFSNGATSLIGLVTGGKLNVLGDAGRCSIITSDMGFVNQYNEEDVNHGQQSSYDYFLEVNPEYMFILDKDAAVGTEGTAATELMDNDIIKKTDAYINGKIIYLSPGSAWYVNDGGLKALDLMITFIEDALVNHGFQK